MNGTPFDIATFLTILSVTGGVIGIIKYLVEATNRQKSEAVTLNTMSINIETLLDRLLKAETEVARSKEWRDKNTEEFLELVLFRKEQVKVNHKTDKVLENINSNLVEIKERLKKAEERNTDFK